MMIRPVEADIGCQLQEQHNTIIKYWFSFAIWSYMQSLTEVFNHHIERKFIQSEIHQSCVRNLVEYFKIQSQLVSAPSCHVTIENFNDGEIEYMN